VAEELEAVRVGLVAPGAAVGEGARPAARKGASERVVAPRRDDRAEFVGLRVETLDARNASRRVSRPTHSKRLLIHSRLVNKK
jgi:hypothetical protein